MPYCWRSAGGWAPARASRTSEHRLTSWPWQWQLRRLIASSDGAELRWTARALGRRARGAGVQRRRVRVVRRGVPKAQQHQQNQHCLDRQQSRLPPVLSAAIAMPPSKKTIEVVRTHDLQLLKWLVRVVRDEGCSQRLCARTGKDIAQADAASVFGSEVRPNRHPSRRITRTGHVSAA